MTDDLTRSPQSRVIDLINHDNPGANVSLDFVTLGEPSVSDQFSRNTSILLTAKPHSGYKDSRTVFYNRLDIAEFFNGSLELSMLQPGSTLDLLTPILIQKGVNLTADDVVVDLVTNATPTLKIKGSSLCWVGEVPVTIVEPTIQLSSIIITTALNVFDMPVITVSSAEQLLAAINAANGLFLDFSDVSFGTPSVLPGVDAAGRNTSVVVTAKAGTFYRGTVTVTYKRVDAMNVYPDGLILPGFYSPFNSVSGLLTLMSQRMSSAIVDSEVINETLSSQIPTYDLTFNGNSYVWTPGSVIEMKLPLIPLDVVIANTILNGFLTANWLLSSKQQLLDLLASNGNVIDVPSEISFSTPSTLTSSIDGMNTSITATAVAGGRYSGSVNIHYNRLNIASVYPSGYVLGGGAIAPHSVYALLQAAILLDNSHQRLDEYVQATILTPTGHQSITVSSLSEVWLPGSVINVLYTPVDTVSNIYHLLDSGAQTLLESGAAHQLDSGSPWAFDGGMLLDDDLVMLNDDGSYLILDQPTDVPSNAMLLGDGNNFILGDGDFFIV